ncbi:MarR family winged helix-turn-helix transcriptional regulator [Microbacterium sp. P05]|uniref:MarR family winged helix-turn-helix transcriptional regulator n=1 Tax=Microbacterium sp. P05 TaxID=3366948 RepID=UPI003744C909
MSDALVTDEQAFWYASSDAERGRRLLSALRTYQASEIAMRRRTREAMSMGENEMLALRFVIRAARQNTPATPRALSDYLGITSASVTALLDRLDAMGHIERSPHPTDRRSITIAPTEGAEETVRHTLGDMHERMMAATRGFDDAEAATIVAFLDAVTNAVDEVAEDASEA